MVTPDYSPQIFHEVDEIGPVQRNLHRTVPHQKQLYAVTKWKYLIITSPLTQGEGNHWQCSHKRNVNTTLFWKSKLLILVYLLAIPVFCGKLRQCLQWLLLVLSHVGTLSCHACAILAVCLINKVWLLFLYFSSCKWEMKNSTTWKIQCFDSGFFSSGGLSGLFENYFNISLAPNYFSSILQGCFVVITASFPLQWVELPPPLLQKGSQCTARLQGVTE